MKIQYIQKYGIYENTVYAKYSIYENTVYTKIQYIRKYSIYENTVYMKIQSESVSQITSSFPCLGQAFCHNNEKRNFTERCPPYRCQGRMHSV